MVLNIAEARGNDAGNARARFSTACGSAKEVRAALNVASDWGYIGSQKATRLDERLDEVCAITWCLGRRLCRPESLQDIAQISSSAMSTSATFVPGM
ncbi:MAG: four helix bundle protein [Deltaproteobacteria bacterium]|nr:MAG: four helix bundle protein [Deltaproteobacteria bacterium]